MTLFAHPCDIFPAYECQLPLPQDGREEISRGAFRGSNSKVGENWNNDVAQEVGLAVSVD